LVDHPPAFDFSLANAAYNAGLAYVWGGVT
jgi:hypothetical protein